MEDRTPLIDQESGKLRVIKYFPEGNSASSDLPPKVHTLLTQAIETVHSPAASIMVASKCLDRILQYKNYTEGSLFEKINKARDDGVITLDMAAWAHEVRLDANEERHSEPDDDEPDTEDAQHTLDMVTAFAEYLLVVPQMVRRGRIAAGAEYVEGDG